MMIVMAIITIVLPRHSTVSISSAAIGGQILESQTSRLAIDVRSRTSAASPSVIVMHTLSWTMTLSSLLIHMMFRLLPWDWWGSNLV